MIGIYDIAKDKDNHPSLVKVGKYNVDRSVTTTNDGVVRFIKDYVKPQQYDNEHMYLLAFDYYDRSLGVFLLGIGTYNSCEVSKRNIAECLILSGARRFMLVHNHPDGALSLSKSDYELVKDMDELADLFDITSLGSFVVTDKGFIGSDMDKPIYYNSLED